MVKLNIYRGRKSQLVSNQAVTNPCCGLVVIFCGFISHLIGRGTINILEIFSGVHSFTGKTVIINNFFRRQVNIKEKEKRQVSHVQSLLEIGFPLI